MGYAGRIQQRAAWVSCSHVHGSVAEALDCAIERQRQMGAPAVAVVGSDLGADGVPRERPPLRRPSSQSLTSFGDEQRTGCARRDRRAWMLGT